MGKDIQWPNARAMLGVESARDILFALLAPTREQQTILEQRDACCGELPGLLQTSLGMELKTRSKSWSTIAEEMWRFLLFSEFAFDLPEALPATLENVPRAEEEYRPSILDLCDRLRNDLRTRDVYLQRADAVERDLNLAQACKDLIDLGERDTFAFEEKTIFLQCMDAMQRDNLDKARSIIKARSNGIWADQGESRAKWLFLDKAVNLLEVCSDTLRDLTDQAPHPNRPAASLYRKSARSGPASPPTGAGCR